jgi:hypothetical protein
MSRIRTALVGVVAARLMLMTAGAASATPEPAMPVVSTSVQSRSVSIGGGWSITSSTEITETSIESEQIQSRTVPVSETRQQSADEQQVFPEYKSQIQQPINSDGTSSWPAKRGVIPVQFKLTKTDVTKKRTKSWTEERSGTQLEQRKNVVTTTSTTYDPSFESLVNDGDDTNDFSALTYTPSEPMKVKDIDELVADYDWARAALTLARCAGASGSRRRRASSSTTATTPTSPASPSATEPVPTSPTRSTSESTPRSCPAAPSTTTGLTPSPSGRHERHACLARHQQRGPGPRPEQRHRQRTPRGRPRHRAWAFELQHRSGHLAAGR